MGDLCTQIATSEEEDLAARVSAYGFLSKYKFPSALVASRAYMTDKGKSAILRSAAIHYVARFSEEEDKETLKKLSRDTDLRISYPAKEGLEGYKE